MSEMHSSNVVSENITINELTKSLSQAQAEFPVIPKDSEVEVKNKEGKFLYSYKYADLTTIINCVRPSLAKYKLGFTQDYIKDEILGSGIVTHLFHESGQQLSSGFVPCPISTQNMKEVAAQFTYAKRISLTAALGISADEDVDSASIDGSIGNSTNKVSKNKSSNKTIQDPGKMDDLSEYVFTTGKNKGKKLGDIPKDKLIQWQVFMFEKGFTKGKDYSAVDKYLNNNQSNPPSMDVDEDIPF